MEEEMKMGELAVTEANVQQWYHDISLKHAESYISENLRAAARNVIAIGYYLKCIRDGKLYEEAGYQNIWDYAKEKYGFSMSTASRYMSRNDKFSQGGNSPIMDERYREYNKSQLQEMLSLDEEQLERVTPDMTAREIREMKRPKEIPYYDIPGQEEMENIPGVMPTSGTAEFTVEDFGVEPEQTSVPQAGSAVLSMDDFTGEEGAEPESVATSQKNVWSEQYDSCPDGIRVCRRIEWGTEPWQQEAGRKECVQCWEQFCGNAEEAEEAAGQQETESESVLESAAEMQQNEEKCCENSSVEKLKWNTEDAYQTRYRYCSAAARKFIETFRDWMVADFTNRVSDVLASEQEFKQRFRASGCTWYFLDPDDTQKAAHVNLFDDYIQFWDGNGKCLGDCEWFYLCTAVQSMWNVVSLERAEQERAAGEPEAEKPQEEPEDIIDAEFSEAETELVEETVSDLALLKDLLGSKKRLLESNLRIPGIEPDDIHIRRQKLEVAALAEMLCELEAMEEEPEEPEQPELPQLTNDKTRKKFIESYETWPLWLEQKETGERYYRYELPEAALVVKVYFHKCFDYDASVEKEWKDRFKYGWGGEEYYLMLDGKHFKDCRTNLSALIEYLKEWKKK